MESELYIPGRLTVKFRRYFVELSLSMVAYSVVLIVSLSLLRHGHVRGAAATVVALLPMVPALGACCAIVRHMRRLDEYQQRVQLEALALASAGTAFLTFSYGFLENVGFPLVSMFAVWPVMAALWVASLAVCRWRYA
jgi:hypothetical protein